MVLHTGSVRDFQTEQDPEVETILDRELLYRAAIERSGASSLDTLDDLFQALESLTKRRLHRGQSINHHWAPAMGLRHWLLIISMPSIRKYRFPGPQAARMVCLLRGLSGR